MKQQHPLDQIATNFRKLDFYYGNKSVQIEVIQRLIQDTAFIASMLFHKILDSYFPNRQYIDGRWVITKDSQTQKQYQLYVFATYQQIRSMINLFFRDSFDKVTFQAIFFSLVVQYQDVLQGLHQLVG